MVCAITSDISFITSYSKRSLRSAFFSRNSVHSGIGSSAMRTLVTATIE